MIVGLRSTLAVAAALAWLGAGAALAQEEPQRPRISVVGEGEVNATPDMAVLTLGVVTEDETARGALVANTEAMSEIAVALRQAGIESRDLQTSGFAIEPKFTQPRRDRGGEAEAPEIAGYYVRNTLTVRIRNIGEAGALLDQAVTLGSNYVSGLSFTVADPKPLQAEARRAAVADARTKAALLAEAAGVALGPVLKIEEREDFDPPRPMMSRSMAMEAAPVPIEAGEIAFRIQVRMDWALGE
jgi:uncharacterized protein YggE